MNGLLGLGGYIVDDDDDDDEDEEENDGTETGAAQLEPAATASEGAGTAQPRIGGTPSSTTATQPAASDRRTTSAASPGDSAQLNGRSDRDAAPNSVEPTAARSIASPLATPSRQSISAGAQEQRSDQHCDQRSSSTIPDAPAERCPDDLQARIVFILEQQQATKRSLLTALRDNREYRNPMYMERTRRVHSIYEYGSCFPGEVFDPHGFPEEDYLSSLRQLVGERKAKRPAAEVVVSRPASQHIASMPASKPMLGAAAADRAKRRARWDK